MERSGAWWRRKYAFGQKVFKVLCWVLVFTVEFIFLRFDIHWINSLQVSSPFSLAYSLSFHFHVPALILSVFLSNGRWTLMEPVALQGEELAQLFSIPKGHWGEASVSASGPLVHHWSIEVDIEVDVSKPGGSQGVEPGGRTQHQNGINMSPEDLG